jgi:hypothetical protein
MKRCQVLECLRGNIFILGSSNKSAEIAEPVNTPDRKGRAFLAFERPEFPVLSLKSHFLSAGDRNVVDTVKKP